MAATIRSHSRVLRPRVNPGDRYLSRVVKYIPTEVIMAYVASIGFVKTLAGTQQRLWSWVIAVSLLILTPLWTMRAASAAGQPTPTRQVIAATMAFAAWTFATGGPFEQFQWYTRALGSIALILVCLCLPIVEWLLPDSAPSTPTALHHQQANRAPLIVMSALRLSPKDAVLVSDDFSPASPWAGSYRCQFSADSTAIMFAYEFS